MQNKSPRILLFCRGRGRGHATSDISIIQELKQLLPAVEVQFVSYATGAGVLASEGHSVIDLGMPEANGYLETFFKAHGVIQRSRYDVVVAHEEFAAITASHMNGIPAVFMSAWLPQYGTVFSESLQYAESVILFEEPGIFPYRGMLKYEPRFTGPLTKKTTVSRKDRALIRSELGIPLEFMMILVSPGGHYTEAIAPISETVINGYARIACENKCLYWIAGSDQSFIEEKTRGVPNVNILRTFQPLERLVAASDIVITKATRGSTMDAAALGVPSISLSSGLNPIDDLLVARIRSNLALNARATDGEVLGNFIETITSTNDLANPQPLMKSVSGVQKAAKILAEEISACLR
jgi:hypothetical protein